MLKSANMNCLARLSLVLHDQGQALTEPQQVQAIRDYQFDQDQVLGKDEEENVLREQVNQQLVQSILRRLSVLK